MSEPANLVWRSELGWEPFSPAAPANPDLGLVVHYDSSDKGLHNKPHEACIEYWNWCRRFHTGTRGWDDVGYSFFGCAHSYILEGRGLWRYQAAQGTTEGNARWYSVTLATGPNDPITAGHIEAVRQLRAWLMEPDTSIAGTVRGHRDFTTTSCPGDKAYALVRNGVFAQAPGGFAVPAPPKPKPSPKKGTVPGPRHPFPLPNGYYFGPRSGPAASVSGYYQRIFNGKTDRAWLKEFGTQLSRRGWSVGLGRTYLRRFGNDGIYGDEYRSLIRAFQRDQGLPANGLLNKRTWDQAFTRPVT
ncbi:N-acetylmuramoyl-L-alanine amidase [Nocardiopsis sp. FR26]|uniref:peptidoglycan recognition protein family protein n=1 Tax=Nocardiopsis sp. FR26 TaxID=2605987 RepID=UPI001F263702|nr:N-acetylmuramoyl-L-alanine amidase [Nocardiopsis sp. FR26]